MNKWWRRIKDKEEAEGKQQKTIDIFCSLMDQADRVYGKR